MACRSLLPLVTAQTVPLTRLCSAAQGVMMHHQPAVCPIPSIEYWITCSIEGSIECSAGTTVQEGARSHTGRSRKATNDRQPQQVYRLPCKARHTRTFYRRVGVCALSAATKCAHVTSHQHVRPISGMRGWQINHAGMVAGWICLETECDGLMRGCACRGSAGWVHVSLLCFQG